MKPATIFLLAAGALALSGCASMRAPVNVHPIENSQNPTWIEVDASRRGVIILPRPDGKGHYVCAEPSPDIAVATITRILAEAKIENPNIDAKTQLEFQTAVIELTKRTQTIVFLREAMYRLCEQSINQNLSPEQVMRLYETTLKTALTLAQADAAKNQADLAKYLSDPQVRDLWTEIFGAPPEPVKP